MFYVLKISDRVRLEPELFALPLKEAIMAQLEKDYSEFIDEDIGAVISVLNVENVGEGVLIPGDAAAYYAATFSVISFKPILQELIYGQITQITNFGAFMDIGPIEAMIHISQTMDDFVSFNKTDSLSGKNSKRTLKKDDLCVARIVSVSHKTTPPKTGLTMRQPGLGKIEWILEDKRKSKGISEKASKTETKESKSKDTEKKKTGKK
ncbi:DNA-directed RNA polymerase [Candidatus Pacearchaeota archaeon]|nr:DNA-directed RNA polymerase [Candidatus Pacearchaeota archaeon]